MSHCSFYLYVLMINDVKHFYPVLFGFWYTFFGEMFACPQYFKLKLFFEQYFPNISDHIKQQLRNPFTTCAFPSQTVFRETQLLSGGNTASPFQVAYISLVTLMVLSIGLQWIGLLFNEIIFYSNFTDGYMLILFKLEVCTKWKLYNLCVNESA